MKLTVLYHDPDSAQVIFFLDGKRLNDKASFLIVNDLQWLLDAMGIEFQKVKLSEPHWQLLNEKVLIGSSECLARSVLANHLREEMGKMDTDYHHLVTKGWPTP